jgi:hypothetical protein
MTFAVDPNMRKKSKYRPKPVLLNPIGYVLEGLEPVRSHTSHAINLKIKNHLALTNLTQGKAVRHDIDVLINMVNVVEALYRLGFGKEYAEEVKAGLDALHAVAVRGKDTNRFILRSDEMNALNLICELHDAQLEVITVKDLDNAIDLVDKERRAKKMRPVINLAEQKP